LNHFGGASFRHDTVETLVDNAVEQNQGVSKVVGSYDFMELMVPLGGYDFSKLIADKKKNITNDET